MTIQHRVIQNSELHEVKGAETAITGTVLTATGTGATIFDRVGVQQLKGSLPTSVADLQVVTDGAGGFKVDEGSYGQFTTTITGIGTPTIVTTADFIPKGMYVNGNGFSVLETGLYKLDFNTTLFIDTPEVGPPTYTQPVLINSTTAATVWQGASGILTLTAGVIYRPFQTNKFTIMGVA